MLKVIVTKEFFFKIFKAPGRNSQESGKTRTVFHP